MKSVLLVFLGLVSASAFADETPKCLDRVANPALAEINKIWRDSAYSRSIVGVKAIHVGDFIETYSVAVSDEVEPSEWIAIVNTKNCKIKFIDQATDGYYTSIWN